MKVSKAPASLLPVLPLRDVVVYPNMVIPLFVGRDRSMKALDMAMEGEKQIVLLAQKSPDIDDPSADDLYAVGTMASIIQLLKLPDGTIKVLVEGTRRVEVKNVALRDETLMAESFDLEPEQPGDIKETAVAQRTLMGLFEQYVKSNRKLPPELLTIGRLARSPE